MSEAETPQVEVPVTRVELEEPGELLHVPADGHTELDFLVSRFGPTQGLPGTRVTILTAFEPNECGATGECSVTIGGVEAPIDVDMHLLEVIVPRWANTGPLCVTWQGRTECGEDFTLLDRPLLYSVWPEVIAVGAGDTTVTLTGDGYAEDSRVYLDWLELEMTYVSPNVVTAVVPASALAAAAVSTIGVFSPNVGRCGALSETLDLTVE